MPVRELQWDDEAASNAEAIQKAEARRPPKRGLSFYVRFTKLLERIREDAEQFGEHPHRFATDGRQALIDGYLIFFDIESPTTVFISQVLHHRQNH